MRTRTLVPLLLLAALIPAYATVLSSMSRMNKALPEGDGTAVVLPAPILRVASLEYDALTSDWLYLKALIFYGSTFDGNKRRKLNDWEYTWLYSILNTVTDLDPYFLDPYFLANGVLAWEAGRVRETNVFLEKGIRYRNWDYWLPFFVGFNYYYFLGDTAKGSEYMMMASRRPGADPFFGFFAGRLAYKANKTENAIIFLEGMLKTTKDETLNKDYQLRLSALRNILYLENAVKVYRSKNGVNPESLSVLIEHRLIDGIPPDPYGGRFYLDKDGSVKTTSDLRTVSK